MQVEYRMPRGPRMELRLLLVCMLAAFCSPGAPVRLPQRRSAQDTTASDPTALPSGSSANSSIATVSSDRELLAALLNRSVTVIRVVQDVVIDPKSARSIVEGDGAVNLTRDVTIEGLSTTRKPRLLDWGEATGLIRIMDITLKIQSMHIQGLYSLLGDRPIILTNDSSGTLRFNSVVVQRTACEPPALQLQRIAEASAGGGETGKTSLAPGAIGGAALLGPPAASAENGTIINLDQQVVSVNDTQYCLDGLSGGEALAIDSCFDQPLLLQDVTLVSTTTKRPLAPSFTGPPAGNPTGPTTGQPERPGADILPEGSGGGDKSGDLTATVNITFSVTWVVCDVFVVPPCSEETGEALQRCVQELIDIRNGRIKSPPPPAPSPSPSPPPSPPASPSPSPSPVPPLGAPEGDSKGVPLAAVVVPVVVGSVALSALVLGFIVWYRRRGGVGLGGQVHSKLESQDSDQVDLGGIEGGMGPGLGGGGGGKGSGGGKGGAAGTAKYSSRYGSSTVGTMSSAGLSASTNTTQLSPGVSPGDSGNTDPTKTITLLHLLGAGSFGRVYYGLWQGQGVAVKIIAHSDAANSKVQQEVALCIRFNHANVVRSLHCVTFESAASEQQIAAVESLRSMSTATAALPPPGLNMETWIVLEYCNAGSLASRLNMKAAVLDGAGVSTAPLSGQESGPSPGAPGPAAPGSALSPAGSLALSVALQQQKDAALAHMRGVLSVARDIAQGMAYLHSLNVCHGDLKCENVLLCYKPGYGGADASAGAGGTARGASSSLAGPNSASGTAPGPMAAGPSSGSLSATGRGPTAGVPFVAKVADFGLSKTFSEASTHMSTATVGTVTHMCPVLLLTGQLRPSCDVYSYGVILWQMATGAVPFAGMRYAEIVYKVAVAGLRPEFPAYVPRRFQQLAEACWGADPLTRPTFEQIAATLSDMLEAADELQAEHDAALAASRESTARPEEVVLTAAPSTEDQAVANQWAAAAAAALLE